MDDLEERIRKRLTQIDRKLRDADGRAIGHSPYLPPHFSAGQRYVLARVLAELASLAAALPDGSAEVVGDPRAPDEPTS